MARVTVEDCMKVIPSRFELVVLAAQRAREISCGAQTTINKDDKDAVIALREIAMNNLAPDVLRESVIKKHQIHSSSSLEDNIDTEDDSFGGDEIAESLSEITDTAFARSSLGRTDEEGDMSSYSDEEEDHILEESAEEE